MESREGGRWVYNNSEDLTIWKLVTLCGMGLAVLVAVIAVMWALSIGFFTVDTKVNNKIIQPQIRSRLDADANYRRGVEAQAEGDVQLFEVSSKKAGTDYDLLKSFISHTEPPYTFTQQQTYDNLVAALQGDYGAINRTVADYNALVMNPDNAGLTTFDPNLPPSLQVPSSEPMP